MNVHLGDIWTAYDGQSWLGFTANSVLIPKWVKRPGGLKVQAHLLVMGAGAAKQVRDNYLRVDPDAEEYPLWRNISEHMGRMVFCGTGCNEGYFKVAFYPPLKLFAFQVKFHFKPPANLYLIKHSAEALAEWMKENPTETVHLNFPGIGAGWADPVAVLGKLDCLLETNINFWVDKPGQYKKIMEALK